MMTDNMARPFIETIVCFLSSIVGPHYRYGNNPPPSLALTIDFIACIALPGLCWKQFVPGAYNNCKKQEQDGGEKSLADCSHFDDF